MNVQRLIRIRKETWLHRHLFAALLLLLDYQKSKLHWGKDSVCRWSSTSIDRQQRPWHLLIRPRHLHAENKNDSIINWPFGHIWPCTVVTSIRVVVNVSCPASNMCVFDSLARRKVNALSSFGVDFTCILSIQLLLLPATVPSVFHVCGVFFHYVIKHDTCQREIELMSDKIKHQPQCTANAIKHRRVNGLGEREREKR